MTPGWTLGHVVEALTGTRPPEPTPALLDFAIDSRMVGAAGLFVALPGSRFDGHDFVEDAFRRGARAALVHREMPGIQAQRLDLREPTPLQALQGPGPWLLRVSETLAALQRLARYWRGRFPHLQVVGVTGSVGKTTTKEVIAQVLALQAPTLKNPGNYNSEIGLPLSLLRARAYHRFAVLEMGFYVPGDIALLCDIARPQVGVVTTIDRVHAERAGSLEAIVQGKQELVQALPETGVAVLNRDDPNVWGMAAAARGRVVSYGFHPEADYRAEAVQVLGLEGLRFRLRAEGRTWEVTTRLLGKHAVYAALAATAVARALGLPWEGIMTALRYARVRLRLRPFRGPAGALILDDAYNAAPRSTQAALDFLAAFPGERIAVLGDMLELGPYEEEGHREVGRHAARIVHALIAVGPRARVLAQAAAQAGLPEQAITWVPDAQHAYEVLRPRLHQDAVVLVKASRAVGLDALIRRLEQVA